ncbi:MAG: PHP domain-containing protein [Elusimicrobiota bacterium]|nr:MAG: PHP domain-containing protein [Elusimicrobiota bacterium]
MGKRVELHCHTIFSDGTLTPAELVSRAKKSGVELLTLTDHDSVSGGAELFAAGREHGLDVRLGIEINCAGEGAADRVHILGYGIDPESPGFQERLAEFRERRTVRASRIVDNLRGLGFGIELAQVRANAHETIGRPHVADALKRLGVVKSRKEAFDRFLVRGKPGFVESMGPSPAEAIALIRDAGGTACLAHPQTAGKEPELEQLRALGLQGVEVNYAGHSPSQVRAYGNWAEAKGLLAVGGSDFHGPGTGREERLGVDYGDAEAGAVEEVLSRCS